MRTSAWRALGLICAVVFYAISLSGQAYELTSPVALSYHEVLRKTYAVGAFAVLGFALERSRVPRLGGVAVAAGAIAIYSLAIEIGQTLMGSTESLAEHGFDVASGLAGGALGAFASLLFSGPRAPARRAEAIALVVVFALLAWGFLQTYARAPLGQTH
jgi:hypothetical protein